MKNILKGITAYGKSLHYISSMRLWKYVFISISISVIVAFGVIGLAWSMSDNLGDLLLNLYPFEWGRGVVEKIADFVGGFAIIGLGLILYKHIVMIVSSPVMSLLSERVEKELTGFQGVEFSFSRVLSDLIRGIKISLRNIIRELFFTILLLILSVIPVFSPLTVILIFLVQSYYSGFGNMDYILERHKNYKESIRFVKGNKGLALGNGIVFMGLLLLGIGFIIAPVLGTIAATVTTSQKIKR